MSTASTRPTAEAARAAVEAAVRHVVPDADFAYVDDDTPLRGEFELDSLDFLGFAETLASRTGVAIAEADYPRLATMATCVAFLTGARDDT
jgi:acyl carrier protein